ncbi:hypothetical protein HO133_004280 [Letharia lupina]|uniref:Uncharacterized protein n=1 Tax=Letharia lupina TaxID=560253 RepID=A0A8H6FJZ5_9LECA|nr:uncharacterized protein HO133_004280 [Letharia lupina]KAF6229943.1 hypothetical protein HO133_004280 [Letharia lupina]
MDEELHHLSFADEKTRLHFLKWQDLYKREKPFQIYIDVPKDAADQRQHNLVFEEGEVTVIKNVRGHEDDYSLDKNGFCYLRHGTALEASRFYDRDAVEETYLPECEELLKSSIEGVDQVCIFDWRVRHHHPSSLTIERSQSVNTLPHPQIRCNDLRKYEGTRIDFNNPVQPLGPATHAHIDQSPAAALRRVQLHLPDEADRLLQGRLRIIK